MDLIFKINNNREGSCRLLTEKLGGVELPYLHVKKGDKTWYIPLVKKNKRYFIPYYDDIGVITLVDGKIHQSINFRIGKLIFANKATPLTLGVNVEGEYHKLIKINYNDVVRISSTGNRNINFINFTTGNIETIHAFFDELEFREE